MSTSTTYLQLTKPAGSENVDVDIINANSDKIDTEAKRLNDLDTLNDVQVTSGTTDSTSYTSTLTGGTACGVAFVAPKSGKVLILNNCALFDASGGFVYCSFAVKTGATIGSGTDVVAASDDNAITSQLNFTTMRMGISKLVTGLTEGASYNAQQQFRRQSSTGTFHSKELIVQPQL